MKPLFMWAGGKNKMLKKYTNYLPEQFDSYIEPFLGGGAMFVWAYKKNPEATFFLNDANEDIMRIYQSIRNDVKAFLTTLDKYQQDFLPLSKPARKEFYYALRQEHAYDYEKWTATEEAATLYFLMKTGFNGIWQINKNTNGRFGTPSGLLNQKDKVYDYDNVMEWHEALQKCTLISGDFTDCLEYAQPNGFAFLDPPYRGSFTQYGVDFDDTLQQKVIKLLNDLTSAGSHVIMSNRDVGDGFFESRQGDNDLVYFDVTYTAGRRKKNTDGTHSAKKAREILMIGEHNG
ncbi:MAG: Dam family site-specific DNA-(adenine-N6)-methyltransferase [Candidatus Peribacter sp.]|nr:Dam family site-specific DNA-(adenine-N6)-methyltransferase [Candidatus Peribacter sp.]